MHAAIFALGSRGDVQPYIALGVGLKNAGHRVHLVTHQNYESLVNASGLEFWPVRGNPQDVAEGEEMRALLEKGKFIAIMRRTIMGAQRAAVQWAEDGLAACQGVDLLMAGFGGLFVALSLGEKLQLPVIQAYLIPFAPTAAFPAAVLPQSLPALGGTFNRLSHQLTRQMMWQGFRTGDRLAREQVLGIPAPSSAPYNSKCTKGLPVLHGFSPSAIPRPPDWGDDIQVTGYWFLDSEGAWQPPPDLTGFLDSDPALIYIGFGTMSSRKLTAENLAESIERAVTDGDMRRRAAVLGERIQAENGVTRAVTVIEQNMRHA